MSKIFLFLRINDWWHYIVPPILAFIYLGIFLSNEKLANQYFNVILFTISIIGTAGYGFFLNDIADIKADFKVGKKNSAAALPPAMRILLLIILLALSLIPLLFLIKTVMQWSLYFLQIVLLSIYSLPPFHLKTKSYLGLIADALYSSVVFSLLAFLVFSITLYFDTITNIVFILSVLVLFIKGFRNILLHQIKDYQADLSSGVRTFAVMKGKEYCNNLIHKVFFPSECLVLLINFIVIFSFNQNYLLLFLISIFLYFLIALLLSRIKMFSYDNNVLLNNFYEEFLPLFILILLSFQDAAFYILLVVHILLFPKKLLFIFLKHYFYHGFLVWLYHKLFTNRYMKRFYSIFRKK